MDETLLIVDDDDNTRDALSLALEREGYHVFKAASGREGMEVLDRERVGILVTDMKMPGVSGMELLDYTRRNHPETAVIMITGHASVESAIDAMKAGAFDYITKPIKLDVVKITLAKAAEKRSLLLENILLKQQLKGKYAFDNFVGTSPAMREVFAVMDKVVNSETTVLIQGESGTGKELVAKAIHYNGPRKDKPFVAINCAAIPRELLESELFGHIKGSFTGAVANKAGKFELADRGTIFLDEIGDMDLSLQGKLLRVLQEREIERVGGARPLKVDVRVISATNINLEDAVKKGTFREDLFYRLNVIPIHLPALRDRVEDIPLLAAHFLKKYREKSKKVVKGFSPGVMDRLAAHEWPGNVRELENVIERAVTLTEEDYIGEDALTPAIRKGAAQPAFFASPAIPESGTDLDREMEGFEAAMINTALRKAGGVKARAAGLLGIKRTTLIEKMRRLKIQPPA